MSWRLRVRHATAYEYAGVVHASYNEARISPLDTPTQFTLEHRVEVHPAANLFRYRDYWGSRVHAFDIHHEHTELVVTGTSVVETAERTPNHDTSVAWDAVDSPGSDGAVLRVPDTDDLHPARRRHRPARRGPAGRADAGRRLPRARYLAARPHRVRPVRHERVDDGGRGAARAPRCLPGLRPPRARGVARRRRTGALRERLLVPGGRRRRGRHARGAEPRVAGGLGRGLASDRPDIRRRRGRAPRARRARTRLRRRRAAQGRVPRRPEPRPHRDRRAHQGRADARYAGSIGCSAATARAMAGR